MNESKLPFDFKKLNNDKHIVRWLTCIRQVVSELRELTNSDVNEILRDYNIYFNNMDEYPRVNFDFPK